MTTDVLERTGKTDMSARKYKAAPPPPAARPARGARPTMAACTQPRYHSEISDDYLNALQRQVDALKPEGFQLTAISEPGW